MQMLSDSEDEEEEEDEEAKGGEVVQQGDGGQGEDLALDIGSADSPVTIPAEAEPITRPKVTEDKKKSWFW